MPVHGDLDGCPSVNCYRPRQSSCKAPYGGSIPPAASRGFPGQVQEVAWPGLTGSDADLLGFASSARHSASFSRRAASSICRPPLRAVSTLSQPSSSSDSSEFVYFMSRLKFGPDEPVPVEQMDLALELAVRSPHSLKHCRARARGAVGAGVCLSGWRPRFHSRSRSGGCHAWLSVPAAHSPGRGSFILFRPPPRAARQSLEEHFAVAPVVFLW